MSGFGSRTNFQSRVQSTTINASDRQTEATTKMKGDEGGNAINRILETLFSMFCYTVLVTNQSSSIDGVSSDPTSLA